MMKLTGKIWHLFYFLGFYLYELLLANLRVARDVLTPSYHTRPGIIEIELLVKTDHEILALTNLITMTPGTLTLDISDDRKKIYVHGMYIKDVEKFKAHIRKLEKRLHRLLG